MTIFLVGDSELLESFEMAVETRTWVGQTIEQDRCRIVGQLGEGGMGVVYHAHDNKLDTDVVIRVPHARMRDDA